MLQLCTNGFKGEYISSNLNIYCFLGAVFISLCKKLAEIIQNTLDIVSQLVYDNNISNDYYF